MYITHKENKQLGGDEMRMNYYIISYVDYYMYVLKLNFLNIEIRGNQ